MPEEKPEETRYHDTTRVGRRGKSERHTSVYRFRDPRKSKAKRYRDYETLAFALANLVQHTNSAITLGNLEGKITREGDVIQAAVVGFIVGDKVYTPEKTEDAPDYATPWYRVTRAKDGGYLTVEPFLPKGAEGATMLYKFPENVGGIINCLPQLIEEAKKEGNPEPYVDIALQLLEVTHEPTKEEVDNLFKSQAIVVKPVNCENLRLDESQKIDSETAAFADYLRSDDKEDPGPQAAVEVSEGMSMEEWERMEAAKKRRLDDLREKDQEMFGFNKFRR